MVCMSLMWRRGSVFAARLRQQDWACRVAGLPVRQYTTKTAPQIPGMEYQVSCLDVSSSAPAASELASQQHTLTSFVAQQFLQSFSGRQKTWLKAAHTGGLNFSLAVNEQVTYLSPGDCDTKSACRAHCQLLCHM